MTVASVALFAYWFRYTCLLILTAKTSKDYADSVVGANHLSLPEVRTQIATAEAPDLDRLRLLLDRDYRLLSHLILHSGASSDQQRSLETRMLAINYRVMSAWFRVSRRFSSELSRRALSEMSIVVAHFANAMGERAASAAAA